MDTNGNQNNVWQTLRYLMCFWNGDSSERPYHHWADSSGERATLIVSNNSHFHSKVKQMDTNGNHNNLWQTLRYLMCFWNGDSSERPYHHWADSSGERATRKVSNHSHFTLCGGGLSSLVRVIMMSWGWISPRSVLLHTIYTMANPNTVLWSLGVPKSSTN